MNIRNTFNPDLHNRRSMRKKGYDYAQTGWYFVTICTYKKECLFGDISDGEMRLNDIGRIVNNEWMRTKSVRENVNLEEYVIMPNHIHAIVVIRSRDVLQYVPTHRRLHSPSKTLGSIVRGFKSAVTKQINILRNRPEKPVWQSNFYDHIIRNEKDYVRIKKYIMHNPENWEDDEENQN